MTIQKAKDIVEQVRSRSNPLANTYVIFISNILGAFDEDNKPTTDENLKIVLKGFAISIILGYMHDLDLEGETDTFLTNNLVNDVASVIWDDWLKEQVEKIEGDNVVPLAVVK